MRASASAVAGCDCLNSPVTQSCTAPSTRGATPWVRVCSTRGAHTGAPPRLAPVHMNTALFTRPLCAASHCAIAPPSDSPTTENSSTSRESNVSRTEEAREGIVDRQDASGVSPWPGWSSAMTRKVSDSASSCGSHMSVVEAMEPENTTGCPSRGPKSLCASKVMDPLCLTSRNPASKIRGREGRRGSSRRCSPPCRCRRWRRSREASLSPRIRGGG